MVLLYQIIPYSYISILYINWKQMLGNMIIPNLDTCYYSYIRYFLLNTIFNAITTIWVYTTNVCKLLSWVMREMMNIVLFDKTSN